MGVGINKLQTSNIESLADSCNGVAVVQGLDDNMNVTNMIILYDPKVISFENINRGANDIMLYNGNISLVKTSVYCKRNGILTAFTKFKAILCKTIFGFESQANAIDDKRDSYNNYWKRNKL